MIDGQVFVMGLNHRNNDFLVRSAKLLEGMWSRYHLHEQVLIRCWSQKFEPMLRMLVEL